MRLPCGCGADDCPACNPGCMDWRECARCGEEFRRGELNGGLCAKCIEDAEAEEAEERRREDEWEKRNGKEG